MFRHRVQSVIIQLLFLPTRICALMEITCQQVSDAFVAIASQAVCYCFA